jgi:hypothetical protein
VRVYFLLLFGINFLFFVWWIPHVHKFFIPSSIPLIMLIALAIHDLRARLAHQLGRRMMDGAVAATITLVFAFNLSSVLELRESRGPFYAEAQILNELAPPDCNIYGIGDHVEALRYYFDRRNLVHIAAFEREFFLSSTGAAPRRDFQDEACAFIPLGFLSEQRYEQRIAGFLDGGSWPEYVAYVLDVRPAAGSDGISYNPFEMIAAEKGPPNVLIDRRRRVHARSLDQLTGAISAEVDLALQKIDPQCPKREYGYMLLVLPRTDLEIERDRLLIFGYSWGGPARWRICQPRA